MAPKEKKKASSKDKKASSKDKKADKKDVKEEKPVDGPDIRGSVDFEAGIIFNKYDKSGRGAITADEFRAMWREAKDTISSNTPANPAAAAAAPQPGAPAGVQTADPAHFAFESGKVFAKLDMNSDGKIDKLEFERMLKENPGVLNSAPKPASPAAPALPPPELLPTEVISGHLLTHYDETAGVAIPLSAVNKHKAMGNTVVPIPEAYRLRQDSLRGDLTTKLLPRREYLISLRRKLQNASAEVEAARHGIEKETTEDVEEVLQRLRSVESSRQSSIKHQVHQLDEELKTIERTLRRVGQAEGGPRSDGSLSPSAAATLGGRVAVEDATGRAGGRGVTLTDALGFPTGMYARPQTTSAAASPMAPDAIKAAAEHVHVARMLETVQEYPALLADIERLSTKPLTVQVEFSSDDFPREVAERLEIVARCDRYAQAMSVKDHMLWKTLQEKKALDNRLHEEEDLSAKYAQEVREWAEMARGLMEQLSASESRERAADRQLRQCRQVLKQHNIYFAPSP